MPRHNPSPLKVFPLRLSEHTIGQLPRLVTPRPGDTVTQAIRRLIVNAIADATKLPRQRRSPKKPLTSVR